MTTFRLSAEQRRYFYELCATGNITRAAQSLYLSRQGLSRSMGSLEEAVGAVLFTRGKGGVAPTLAGRTLLRHLREEDRAWEQCLARIRSLDGADPAVVRVGLLSMFVGYDEKRKLLARFEDDAALSLSIIDGDHDELWRAVADGKAECAVTMAPPRQMDVPFVRLTDDTLSVLVACDDELARKDTVDFACDLRGRTVVQTSPYKERLYADIFRTHGIEVDPIAPDRNLMLAHVSSRRQVFIIQTGYARRLVTNGICLRPLTNAPFSLSSVLVVRPDMPEAARRVAREIADGFGKAAELDALIALIAENHR